MHDQNSFLTLTYNNDNLPESGSLVKRDFQLFVKRLRKQLEPKQIRFFACGEYGDKFMRPHYHMCLFGHDFDDKEVCRFDNHRTTGTWNKGHDHTLYKSATLADIWGKGFCSIGDLTFETAAYVARYVTKKITGSSPEAVQKFEERYGQDKIPEFALMSRRPGIGATWFSKYSGDVFPKDFVTVNGTRFKTPRYYDHLAAKEDPHAFLLIKEERIANSTVAFPEDRDSMSRNRHRESLTKSFSRGDL